MRSSHLVVRGLVVAGVILGLAACREKKSTAAGTLATGNEPPGAYGTTGMTLMDSVNAFANAMERMTPDQIAAAIPTRSVVVTNLLAQMRRDMQQANVTPDPAWTATSDSVQRDLSRMTSMTRGQLKQSIPAQNDRLERLITTYRASMAKANK